MQDGQLPEATAFTDITAAHAERLAALRPRLLSPSPACTSGTTPWPKMRYRKP